MLIYPLRSDSHRLMIKDLLDKLDLSKQWEIELREYRSKRTTEQNRRYWALMKQLSESVAVNGRKFSPEAWHEHIKREFVGREELPNGEVRGMSTTKLDVGEFAELMTLIEAWAAGEHGVILLEDC